MVSEIQEQNFKQLIEEAGGMEAFAKENAIKDITKREKRQTSKILKLGDKKTAQKKALINTKSYIRWRNPDGTVQDGYYPFAVAKGVEKIDKGEDYKISINGQTGRGKSMKALYIAQLLHDEIGVLKGSWRNDYQIYNVENFLQVLSMNTPPPYGFLKAFIFDEAGKTINKAEYWSALNRAVRDTLNLQRARQNVYIFVLPYYEELDSGVKKHIDVKLNCVRNKKTAKTHYNVKDHVANRSVDASDWRKEKGVWKDIPLPKKEMREAYDLKESMEKFLQPDRALQRIKEKQREKEEKSMDIL